MYSHAERGNEERNQTTAMTITSIPSLLGIFALAFLLLLLVKVIKQPAEDRTAKQLLILLLIGLLSMAYCFFYIYAGMARYWPRLSSIEIGLVYWIGPSLYFYIRRINGGPSPFANPLNLLHWFPAILVELLLLPYFLIPLPEKAALLETRPGTIYGIVIWATWLGFHVHLLVYIYFCLPLLRVYRQRILDNYSAVSLLNLRWLQLLCYGFFGQILVERLLPVLKLTSSGLSDTAGLTYSALGQSRLQFVGEWQPASANGKYYRSGLRDDSARYYLDKLNKLMAAEQYYLESDLSLQALAERLKISPHHLSQILNGKLARNFYDYINELRVAHAKQALLRMPHQAIIVIAFESGYNSKNSFYNAFKRHTGMTPSDYRRKHQQPQASA
jgi:AraC-like DNA-binding protein